MLVGLRRFQSWIILGCWLWWRLENSLPTFGGSAIGFQNVTSNHVDHVMLILIFRCQSFFFLLFPNASQSICLTIRVTPRVFWFSFHGRNKLPISHGTFSSLLPDIHRTVGVPSYIYSGHTPTLVHNDLAPRL